MQLILSTVGETSSRPGMLEHAKTFLAVMKSPIDVIPGPNTDRFTFGLG